MQKIGSVVFESERKFKVWRHICMRWRRAIAHRVLIMAKCGRALRTHTLRSAMNLLKWLASSKVCQKMSRGRQMLCAPGAPRKCWGLGGSGVQSRFDCFSGSLLCQSVRSAPLVMKCIMVVRGVHVRELVRSLVSAVPRPRVSLIPRAGW